MNNCQSSACQRFTVAKYSLMCIDLCQVWLVNSVGHVTKQISDLKVRIMCLSLQVIRIERPLRCLGFPPICCCCCLQQVEVQSPPGTVIGYIKQDLSFLSSWFSVVNVDEEVVLKITGPPFRFGEVEFQVYFQFK